MVTIHCLSRKVVEWMGPVSKHDLGACLISISALLLKRRGHWAALSCVSDNPGTGGNLGRIPAYEISMVWHEEMRSCSSCQHYMQNVN